MNLQRKNSTIYFSLCCFFLLMGCQREPQGDPVVININDWDSVDYAKIRCWSNATTGKPCPGDPTPEVRSFEAKLEAAFQEASSCHGLVLTTYPGPKEATPPESQLTAKSKYSILLDYVKGETSQWTIFRESIRTSPSPGNTIVAEGQGTPSEIIREACAIAKDTGGVVVH